MYSCIIHSWVTQSLLEAGKVGRGVMNGAVSPSLTMSLLYVVTWFEFQKQKSRNCIYDRNCKFKSCLKKYITCTLRNVTCKKIHYGLLIGQCLHPSYHWLFAILFGGHVTHTYTHTPIHVVTININIRNDDGFVHCSPWKRNWQYCRN